MKKLSNTGWVEKSVAYKKSVYCGLLRLLLMFMCDVQSGYLQSMLHLWRNRVVFLYYQDVWKTVLEEWYFKWKCRLLTVLLLSLFLWYFSQILLVQMSYLISPQVKHWRKWIKEASSTILVTKIWHLSFKISPLQFVLQINPFQAIFSVRIIAIFCCNASDKIWSARGIFHHPSLLRNCLT